MAGRSRLAVLIRLAQLEEHRRLAELGGAARRAADAAAALTTLHVQLQLAHASEASFARASAARSAAELVQALRHRQSLDRESAQAEQLRGEADAALEAARARTAAARHRLRAIQKVERKRALLELRAERRRQQRRQESLERALRERADHAG